MVYKIGNLADLETLPLINDVALELLYHHASVLTYEYGENRKIDNCDGGYILYAVPGTDTEELKAFFDVSKHTPEHVDQYDTLCEALYVLNNNFTVVIIMSLDDAPTELLNEIDY
jgi:hypothetical protein